MNLPNLQKETISFSCGGFELISNDEVEAEQLGYSHLDDGTILCGVNEGDWRSEWVVVGRDSLQGDPVFIDTSDSCYPVYTAAHGEGDWDPVLLSSSYTGFLKILEELKKLASARQHPMALERNPMTQKEYDDFIKCCRDAGCLDDPYLWEIMVSDEEAGVGVGPQI